MKPMRCEMNTVWCLTGPLSRRKFYLQMVSIQESRDQAIFSCMFIREVPWSGVRASVTSMGIRKPLTFVRIPFDSDSFLEKLNSISNARIHTDSVQPALGKPGLISTNIIFSNF